jgi:hypothetical protein
MKNSNLFEMMSINGMMSNAGVSWMTDLQAHTLLGRCCHIKILLSITRSDTNFSIMSRTEQLKQSVKGNDWWVFWKVHMSRKCCP